jgi:hypothetical protein
LTFLLGFLIAAAVGLTGVGAGSLTAPLLLASLDVHRYQRAVLLLVGAMVAGMALGGLAGVLLGAWLSSVLPARPLRAALSVALFGLGLELCWKACF